MAVEIGTASNHVDLYNRLYNFLTSNADLVAAGQNWTRVWGGPPPYPAHPESGGPSDILLKGPGSAGTDNIYVGMRLTENPDTDDFGMWLAGAQGVVPTAESYFSHINSAPTMHVPLFNQATPYWFVANGRRFVVVAKVSTTFVAFYQGFFLPYATPLEYPYPMISSGCSRRQKRWSDENPGHTHFCMPNISRWDDQQGNLSYPDYGSYPENDGLLRVMSPSGEWVMFDNAYDAYKIFPWAAPSGQTAFTYGQRTLFGGNHMLYPATLVSTGSRMRGTLGVLEGVFHCTGFGNSAENIITVNGVDHLVVQNMFRTGFKDYWALALE